MKILHIGWGYQPFRGGGLIEYAEDLMEALSQRGHDVHYFFAGRYDFKFFPYVKKWKRNGVFMHELMDGPNVHEGSLGTQKPLHDISEKISEKIYRKVLYEVNPDLVHIQELPCLTANIINITKEFNKPIIFSLGDYWTLCPTLELLDSENKLCLCFWDGSRCIRCNRNASKSYFEYKTKIRIKYSSIRIIMKRFPVLYEFSKKLYHKFRYVKKQVEQGRKKIFKTTTLKSNRFANEFKQRRVAFIEALNKVDLIHAKSHRVEEIFRFYGVTGRNMLTLNHTHKGIAWIKPLKKSVRYPIVFGYLGGLNEPKGAHTLLQAFSNFDKAKARLILYGSGSREFITRRKLANNSNIEFRGKYKRIKLNDILKEIDVGVIPSIWEEAYGLVGNEFLAAKIPIIGSRIGGIPDYVEDGVNGFLFKAGDVEELKRKIQLFIDDPNLIEKFKRNIKPVKTMEEHVVEIEDLYRDLLTANE